VGCGHAADPAASDRPLELGSAIDWAPAAGLSSIVVVRPKEIMAHAELLPPLADVLPDDAFETFARRHGAVDPRGLDELVVASYHGTRDATLVLARGSLDPKKLEGAFGDRVASPKRFVDQPGGPLSTVVRLEGDEGDEEHEMVLFGRQAVGFETEPAAKAEEARTHVGPLRAAELFAFGKLKKSSPALRAAPLDAVARLAGDAPVRIFFPGPFSGDAEQGLAGLLKGTTAVGIAIAPETRADGKAAVHVTLVLTGGWGAEAGPAAQRLGAAINTLSDSGLGRLCGVNHPLRGPDVRGTPEALYAEATVDATQLGKGLHAAVASDVAEMMKF